jgi:hypothetical protein
LGISKFTWLKKYVSKYIIFLAGKASQGFSIRILLFG